MNKTKIILASVGGVAALAVLVMAFLVWTSLSAKTAALEGDEEEGTPGLDEVTEKAEALSRKPVYPCVQSVKEILADREALVSWKEEALKLSARGDRPQAPTTPAAFKEFIVGDAHRLAALPGKEGPIMNDKFDFGPFKDYISEGKMPADADLVVLQRQWDDFALLAELLQTNGVTRITSLSFKPEVAAPKVQEVKPKKAKKGKKAVTEKQTDAISTSVHGYIVTFEVRPAEFVKIMNALETAERFIVVDDFAFAREKDAIALALGVGEKKEAEQSPSRRRGRRGARGAVPEEEKAKAIADNGIVTDPILGPSLVVTMTVSVHDFKSMEDAK